MRYITDIIGKQMITQILDIPAYMKGSIILRGNIIPILNVRLYCGKAIREFDDRTCVIIIDIGVVPIDLIVGVSEGITISAEEIWEVSKANQVQSGYIVKKSAKQIEKTNIELGIFTGK